MFTDPTTIFFFQDSVQISVTDTLDETSGTEDSLALPRRYTDEEVSDIFETLERRERELDSLARIQSPGLPVKPVATLPPTGFDTAAVPYNLTPGQNIPPENPLKPFRKKLFAPRDTSQPVFIENPQALTDFRTEQTPRYMPDAPSSRDYNLRPDWLLVVIIASLALIAWLKLFYNKFLDQTMQSLMNFQLSAKLLRDSNIFSKRVAVALNLNFIFTGGASAYLLLGYFGIKPFPLGDLASFFSYSGIIASLLILRWIVSNVVGHVFQKKQEFREYIHQILLIYKNLGIYLVPFVIGIAYIREDLRIYLVYMSFMLIAAALILRLIKGFKILMNKDVLIFYLILYLCILEILPLLVFYKFFSASILAG